MRNFPQVKKQKTNKQKNPQNLELVCFFLTIRDIILSDNKNYVAYNVAFGFW